jgi:hypothetical protein
MVEAKILNDFFFPLKKDEKWGSNNVCYEKKKFAFCAVVKTTWKFHLPAAVYDMNT